MTKLSKTLLAILFCVMPFFGAQALHCGNVEKSGLLALYFVSHARDHQQRFVVVAKGSGFVVKSAEQKLFVVTAYHLLSNIFGQTVSSQQLENLAIIARVPGQEVPLLVNLQVAKRADHILALNDVLLLELVDKAQEKLLLQKCSPLPLANQFPKVGAPVTVQGINFFKAVPAVWQADGQIQANAASNYMHKICLQANISTFAGISGSPLFDSDGRVVAIASFGWNLNSHDLTAQFSTSSYFTPFNSSTLQQIIDPASSAKRWLLTNPESERAANLVVAQDALPEQEVQIIRNFDLLTRNEMLRSSQLINSVVSNLDAKVFNIERFRVYVDDLQVLIMQLQRGFIQQLNALSATQQLKQMAGLLLETSQLFNAALQHAVEQCRLVVEQQPAT